MSKLRTPEQWLAYGDDLPVKLAGVLTPGPWKHDIEEIRRRSVPTPLKKCRKCGQCYPIRHSSCSVPDPIKIDWNTAKYWQGKCILGDFEHYAQQVVIADGGSEFSDFTITECLATLGAIYDIRHAKLPLIAAAMAAEGSK